MRPYLEYASSRFKRHLIFVIDVGKLFAGDFDWSLRYVIDLWPESHLQFRTPLKR